MHRRALSLVREMHCLRFSLFFVAVSAASIDLNIITPTESLRDGDSLVSLNNVFELGFFTLDETAASGGKRRYLGVWYKQLSPRAIVWVANRETPLLDRSGVLNMSSRGDLRLFDGKKKVFWSSNASKPAESPVLQLLPTGNLIVRDGTLGDIDMLLWQSFDYPLHTLVAGMKLGKNFLTQKEWSLSSWKSPEDPSAGEFSLQIDTRGLPQLMLKKRDANHYRLGSWNGLTFSGTPDFRQANNIFKYVFVLNDEQVTFSWEPLPAAVTRIVLNSSGFVERFVHPAEEALKEWIHVYVAPRDRCDYYSVCGAFAICSISKNAAVCSCLQGFVPKLRQEWNMSRWSGGCIRKTKLNCEKRDDFVKYEDLKLPDTSGSWYDERMSLADCRRKCLKNCSCTAYANMDLQDGGTGCVLWFGDLMDIREFSEGGQDVYIRIANPEAGHSSSRAVDAGIIVGSVMFVTAILVALIFCARRRAKRNRGNIWKKEVGEEDMDLPIFDISTIARATDDFSDMNFLGQGGFGPVYKGTLAEGQEVAVKRLSANSGQGVEEFKNEVKLIAKLQHRNLVRLLGCCIQGDERMLVYEYMPNKSLDYFIFDESRSKALNWQKRMNIIGGIARGLLYLHQDSRLRIIHRDLKASNVLLDNDMNPKISDFGLAKSFGGDQIEANTNKVVGTYGYMSPEYAVDGRFSVKSDVFSFGVLVLEIVTGKKNRGFRHSGHDLNLLGHAWKLWLEDRALELTEEVFLGETCVVSEALRCVHVGLLCVQQKPEDRPNMASVVLMLGSDGSLPRPKQPGFFTGSFIFPERTFNKRSFHYNVRWTLEVRRVAVYCVLR